MRGLVVAFKVMSVLSVALATSSDYYKFRYKLQAFHLYLSLNLYMGQSIQEWTK